MTLYKIFSSVVTVIIFNASPALATCEGSGTAITFGNGMFNDKKHAYKSVRALESILTSALNTDHNKKKTFNLAYKPSEQFFEQIFKVAAQKGITDFEEFWAWFYSIKKSPNWFLDEIEKKAAWFIKENRRSFTDYKEYFETLSDPILNGYNVILVSHSQGNFYANKAMRELPDYVDNGLMDSISGRRKNNPNYPKFSEIFANVQVATPVSETVDSSPYFTFHDDLIMLAVRKTIGALPANIQSIGIGLPPMGDVFGHNFVDAYLRSDESRSKIVEAIKQAHSKLRYPIHAHKRAGVVEQEIAFSKHEDTKAAELRIDILAEKDGASLTSAIESNHNKNGYNFEQFVNCIELPLGKHRIIASSNMDGVYDKKFKVSFWPDGKEDLKKEKPVEVTVHAKGKYSQYWNLGMIHVKPGQGKEPLDVNVEVFSSPEEYTPSN